MRAQVPGPLAAHTFSLACRMREASLRPKREYKPKAREPIDLGEPEQSNGGFPCTPAPSITGNRSKGPPGLVPLPTLQKGPPGMGPGFTPMPSAHLCALSASSFVILSLFRQAHPDPQQEHA